MAPAKRSYDSLTAHYFDYLSSPAVVVIILILVGPLLYGLAKRLREPSQPHPKTEYDCYRLGLSKRSRLDNQFQGPQQPIPESKGPIIQALFTYPIKSCRGVELAASTVGSTGLRYDRMFTFAQLVSKAVEVDGKDEKKAASVSRDWNHQWRFITQREFPRLALLETELWVPHPLSSAVKGARGRSKDGPQQQSKSPLAAQGGWVVIRFPFEPSFNPLGLRTETVTLRVPLMPTSERARGRQYKRESLSIWKDTASAINVTNEIHPESLAKLKYFLGVSNPLGLFRVDDSNLRPVTRSLPKDRPGGTYFVGFGDAFPLHILSISSANALANGLPAKAKLKSRLDARRFRANIYVDGVPAYDEDTWKRLHIGKCLKRSSNGKKPVETDGEYHVACRTARCTLPNVDQESGVKDVNEPYTTLRKTRDVDSGASPHPCLGMQMIPLFSQGILSVGDEISVVERGEHRYEKMFG